MKKILTFGVFDYFHLGHLIMLEKAKKYGDYLIVAVQEDKAVRKYKPDANMYYNNENRIYLLKSIKIVDEVVTYTDVDKDIKKIDFDVFAVGEDQNHEGFVRAIKWCRDNGKEVVFVKRTKNISSKDIKESVEKLK